MTAATTDLGKPLINKHMAHYYLPDGTLIDGLRAARKISPLPLPSPTTVLSLMKGEGLIQYFKRQMWLAAITTPRAEGASDEDHYDACCRWADEHATTARNFGGDLHDQISKANHWFASGSHEVGDCVLPSDTRVSLYCDWLVANVKRVFHVEQFVKGDGYGGREDFRVELLDGRSATVDFKSQDVTGKRGFNHYTNWALQLGAYSQALPVSGSCPRSDVVISVCISSKEPAALEAYEWPKPATYYHELFLGLLAIWRLETNYHE